MDKLSVACIGAGYFSHFHLDAWNRIDGVKISALCDLDTEKVKPLALKYGIAQTFTDVEKMLDTIQPDFVDIITPPNTHFSLVRSIADRQIPIICQKPLAPSLGEAREIVAYAESKNVPLLVHENWRFQPWYRKIAQMIKDGILGELFALSTKMRLGDGWKKDAYMERQPYFRTMKRLLIYETAIHFIDTYRFLAGDVRSVYAQLFKRNKEIAGEDAGIVHFNFKNGAVAIFDGNRYNESIYENNRYTFGDLLIDGSKGSIRLDGNGNLSFQPLGESSKPIEYEHSQEGFAGDSVFSAQQHFLNVIKGIEMPETSGQDYLKNLEVQEAIYNSNDLNQVVKLGE